MINQVSAGTLQEISTQHEAAKALAFGASALTWTLDRTADAVQHAAAHPYLGGPIAIGRGGLDRQRTPRHFYHSATLRPADVAQFCRGPANCGRMRQVFVSSCIVRRLDSRTATRSGVSRQQPAQTRSER